MGTVILFIVIIFVISLFAFAKDSHKENNKLLKEGGMRVKYKTLINNFIEPDSGLKVVEETSNYVCVAMRNTSETIVFHFQHTFNKINITFEMKNIFLGEHKLSWKFPETMSQVDMIEQIESRIRQYMDVVSSKFN